MTDERSGAPWFVQFWPVFIACLMAASIAASLGTVVIAYRHADEDVRATEVATARGPVASGVGTEVVTMGGAGREAGEPSR